MMRGGKEEGSLLVEKKGIRRRFSYHDSRPTASEEREKGGVITVEGKNRSPQGGAMHPRERKKRKEEQRACGDRPKSG